MVGMNTTFGVADQQTPHGGAPFTSWKKGFGFGYGKGPGGASTLHPAMPSRLRFTPNGDRAFASNPFWRRKYEVGQANSFGIGDRPSLHPAAGPTIGPDNYGDVSVCVGKTKKGVIRPGIQIKPRFPSIEEKYRDLSWPKAGPGPAKYNTSIPVGQSSWSTPTKACAYTMGARSISQTDLREMMAKPAPGEYNVQVKPGKNAPDRHGTLYDVSIRGKTREFKPGEASPGPARYNIKGQLDQYGLDQKIRNVKGPPDLYWRDVPSTQSGELERIDEDTHALGREQESPKRTLMRVESAPV